MGLWNKIFGKKYLSWDEYQQQMQDLEDQVWQQKSVTKKKLALPQGFDRNKLR